MRTGRRVLKESRLTWDTRGEVRSKHERWTAEGRKKGWDYDLDHAAKILRVCR